MLPKREWWNDEPKVASDGSERLALYGGAYFDINSRQLHKFIAKQAIAAERNVEMGRTTERPHVVYRFIAGAYKAGKRCAENRYRDAFLDQSRPLRHLAFVRGVLVGLAAGIALAALFAVAWWGFS